MKKNEKRRCTATIIEQYAETGSLSVEPTSHGAGNADGRSVTFPASIPPTETAIKIHGEGGARLQLDIAESDMGAFLPVLPLRGKMLVVTLSEDLG